MAFLGVMPGERSSGGRVRLGGAKGRQLAVARCSAKRPDAIARRRASAHGMVRGCRRRFARRSRAWRGRHSNSCTGAVASCLRAANGRVGSEVLGINICSHRQLEPLLRGFNAACSACRQRVLNGRTPDQVVAERSDDKPELARLNPHGRAGSCDITRARSFVDRANEALQPNRQPCGCPWPGQAVAARPARSRTRRPQPEYGGKAFIVPAAATGRKPCRAPRRSQEVVRRSPRGHRVRGRPAAGWRHPMRWEPGCRGCQRCWPAPCSA